MHPLRLAVRRSLHRKNDPRPLRSAAGGPNTGWTGARTLPWWLVLYVAIALIATFLQPPIPLHSTRSLAAAWDMWVHQQFWVPHLNGAPYPQKAPLLFWLIQAGWAAFGVTSAWPRVLMIAVGATELILARRMAGRLFPDRPEVADATPWFLLALSFGFLYSLQIMYDGLLALCVLASLLCLLPARATGKPRWLGFAVCIGLGLLTKGPVMLVHVAPVWLLGPGWSDFAREHRVRWYGCGVLAVLGGCAMLAAWVIPATHLGGSAYAANLLFKQTGGRVVDAFIHKRPFWWYLPWVVVLLFPFVLWPRMWAGLWALRRPAPSGVRMTLAWLAPAFLIFSAFRGKQTYYLVPELPAAAIVMAAGVGALRRRNPVAARSNWLGPWPLGLAAIAIAAFLFALPALTAAGRVHDHWLHDFASASAPFGALYALLGAFLLIPGRHELERIAVAGVLGAAGAYALFALALYPAFDVRPAAHMLARAQARGEAIGDLAEYTGEFAFAGRLTHPVTSLRPGRSLRRWAAAHPDGLVIAHPERLAATDLKYAQLVQPYRGVWLVIWQASTLVDLRRGWEPPAPAKPPVLLPSPGYWRYAAIR